MTQHKPHLTRYPEGKPNPWIGHGGGCCESYSHPEESPPQAEFWISFGNFHMDACRTCAVILFGEDEVRSAHNREIACSRRLAGVR